MTVKLHWVSLTFYTSDTFSQLFFKMEVCSVVFEVNYREIKAMKYKCLVINVCCMVNLVDRKGGDVKKMKQASYQSV